MKIKLAVLFVTCCLLVGCGKDTYLAGIDKGLQSSEPVERGCSYIAGAIVFSSIIRALFNK